VVVLMISWMDQEVTRTFTTPGKETQQQLHSGRDSDHSVRERRFYLTSTQSVLKNGLKSMHAFIHSASDLCYVCYMYLA